MVLTLGHGRDPHPGRRAPGSASDLILPRAALRRRIAISQEVFALFVLAAVVLCVLPAAGDQARSGCRATTSSTARCGVHPGDDRRADGDAALIDAMDVCAPTRRHGRPREVHLAGSASPSRGVMRRTRRARLHACRWWAHALLILVFLNYLPYSKHLHVLTSLHQRLPLQHERAGRAGVMRPMDLEAEDAEQFGASATSSTCRGRTCSTATPAPSAAAAPPRARRTSPASCSRRARSSSTRASG